MQDPTFVNIKGIKCDAPGCDYTDMQVVFGNGKQWLNVPCPKCGAPLLTKKDYAAVRLLLLFSRVFNRLFGKVPDDAKFTRVPITLNGSGTISVTLPADNKKEESSCQ